jgi:hypothetical protein
MTQTRLMAKSRILCDHLRYQLLVECLIKGYSEDDASAETLAAARHLFETACRFPILIRQS